MFDTEFGLENDMCVHKCVLDLLEMINMEMKNIENIDCNGFNVMDECDEWKKVKEQEDIMLKQVIIGFLSDEQINPYKSALRVDKICHLIDKNNVVLTDPYFGNKKGKYILSFAQRHPETFGTTKESHPRIWWKGHVAAEKNLQLIREDMNQTLNVMSDLMYWCIVQCQRATQKEWIDVNCLIRFHETLYNVGFNTFHPSKNIFPQPMKRGDLFRFFRLRKSRFGLINEEAMWYVRLVRYDPELYLSPYPPHF